jgi:hypothetical protein
LSSKEGIHVTAIISSEEGNEFYNNDGEQRPTNPDSSDLSVKSANSFGGKFKKDEFCQGI